MEHFNYHRYENLKDNQILNIKLQNSNDWLFVKRTSQRVVQAWQPAHTPITKITLEVIRNLELYKEDIEDEENVYRMEVEPEEVEQFELIEI